MEEFTVHKRYPKISKRKEERESELKNELNHKILNLTIPPFFKLHFKNLYLFNNQQIVL